MKSLSCEIGRAVLLVLLVDSVALGYGAPDPVTQSSNTSGSHLVGRDPSFSFIRFPLPGFWWPEAVAYGARPYAIGTANDGRGYLTVLYPSAIGLSSIEAPPRVAYDLRAADFNGDGIVDFISSVYSPTNIASWAYLYLGNGDGTFTQDPTFGMEYIGPDGPGFRGRIESIVVADFSNDGAVDIFMPTYTYLDSAHDLSGNPAYVSAGPPPNVYNALQSYLLLNDGTGRFVERAVQSGVSMHSALSGLLPVSTDPEGNQPEGAQAVDFNMDGLIDLYVGGHLFINQGVDDEGVPHFKDMAATWGLTQEVLHAAPPSAPDPRNAIPAYMLVTDEGAKFLDWNNDGRLDLLLFRWDLGSAHGARLFEFAGTQFVERGQALTTRTATCTQPAAGNVPFFESSITTGSTDVAGINAYDLDNDGLEDVLVSGDSAVGSVIFRNNGCGFTAVPAGDLSGRPGSTGMALADVDGNGSIDAIYTADDGAAYYENTTVQGHSFTVEVVGSKGEHNQFGRVVQVFPPGANQIYTRVVDGGSGYLTQSQYPILVGTPHLGAHVVKVYFAPLRKCTYGGPPCRPAVLTFSILPGEYALAYAPSTTHPSGYALVAPDPHRVSQSDPYLAPPPQNHGP